ncbi:uncharacterized protein LOC123037274 [Drosophila rhopaloa]|uniref:Uncharacterized protein n=1 Tax=Drosophila rhopaloa TaxID=1041015 RepID=A0ABM5J349_DRORH|nr:uncharacterized protein LOC123037274 [Drosophila rhopaloa]
MYRSKHIFSAMALLVWILVTVGETKKEIIFNSINCSMRNKVFSKVECQLHSRLALNILAIVSDQKAVDKLTAVCDAKIFPENQQKMIRVRNLKLDFCSLKKNTEKVSLIGIYYNVIRKSIVSFPDKCPFKKNSILAVRQLKIGSEDVPQYLPLSNYSFIGKIYAGNELAFVVKLTGGLYEIKNNSIYAKPIQY